VAQSSRGLAFGALAETSNKKLLKGGAKTA
jgi:hypothetical protein